MFYFLNGYRFDYDEAIRSILKQFGTDEAAVDDEETIAYLQSHTDTIDLAGEIEQWREELIQNGLAELTGDASDPND